MLKSTDGVPASEVRWKALAHKLIPLLVGFGLLAGGAPFHSNHWHL